MSEVLTVNCWSVRPPPELTILLRTASALSLSSPLPFDDVDAAAVVSFSSPELTGEVLRPYPAP